MMEITKEIKFIIALHYYGKPFLVCYNIEKNPVIETFRGKNAEEDMYEPDLYNKRDLLILKQLSEITDEDMIWVFDTVNNLHEQRRLRPDWVRKKSIHIDNMKANISSGYAHCRGGYLSDSAVHQYLVSKGYDVPFRLLGWKTLKESGLAIYEKEI